MKTITKALGISLLFFLLIPFHSNSQTLLSEDFSTFVDSVNPPLPTGWKNIDSTSPPTGQVWRFDNPGGQTIVSPMSGKVAILDSDWYGPGNAQDAYLTSGNINASSATTVILEFDHHFRDLTGNVADVEVWDGNQWNIVASYAGNTNNNPTSESIDISSFAAGQSAAQIRFHYSGSWAWYWYIDNVEVFQPAPDDLSVLSIDSLINGCSLDSIPVSITVGNVGSTTVNSYSINYTVNGGTVVTENISTAIAPGATVSHTFSQFANVSTVGNYTIDAYTFTRNDINNANDTASGMVMHLISNSVFPYTEGFESGNGGWLSGGVNDSWQLGTPANATINSAAGGTQAYVTNLTGNYNNNEESFVVSPCFDFSSLAQPQFKMNAWIESESGWDGTILQSSIDGGLTWQTVGSLNDPVNWYNGNANAMNGAIGNGDCWTNSSPHGPGWVLVEHDLTGLAGQSSVRLRVFHATDGSVQREGFAFDNILIQDAPDSDVNMVAVTSPETGCGLTAADSVRILVNNAGSAPLDTIPVYYNVNGGTNIIDTIFTVLNPGDTISFTFSTTSNFSVGGQYLIFAASTLGTDGNPINDTTSSLIENTLNTLQTVPYLETFDGAGFVSGTGFDNIGSQLGNGWTALPSGSPDFFWGARNTPTGSGATGPDVDHTGNNGNFIYIEGSNGGNGSVAELYSPCIDLSGVSAPRIEFWYHKFGASMANLYVDVYDGSTWVLVDSIIGQTQTANLDPYLRRDISIASFAGNTIQVRFRSGQKTGFGTDMAIDDFKVYEPGARDAGVASIVNPTTECGLGSADSVRILISNNGTGQLDTIPVGFQLNNGTVIIDTLFFPLPAGDTVLFTFSTTINLSATATYDIDAFTLLSGDSDFTNDSAFKAVSNTLRQAPYFQNFDGAAFVPGAVGSSAGSVLGGDWTANPEGSPAFSWGVGNGPTGSGGTGPDADHTTGSTNYIFIEGSNGANGSVAELYSPCIDLSPLSAPRLEFWYHKFGTNMATLYIDVNSGGNWVTIDSIVGQTQTASPDPFLRWDASINQFAGTIVQVRFRSSARTGLGTDMAIDDFRVYEPSPRDAEMVSIVSPSSGCGLGSADSIRVQVGNAGTVTLDTIPVGYTINSGAVVVDTIFSQLMPGNSITFTFSTTANLSGSGTYTIEAFTTLANDGNSINDTTDQSVQSVAQVGFPYFEDFEATNGGWTVEGTNPTWAWGAPAGVDIAAAGNGVNAWVTNLTGNYNNNELSYLVSPCIDLSALTNDPTVRFKRIYFTETGFDEVWVDLSTDGGNTWNKVTGNPNAINWYNNTANQYWEGSFGFAWLDAVNVLSGAAGNSDVRVRFVMSSDGSVQEEGFGVDSFAVDLATGVKDISKAETQLLIYPNPSEGQFIIQNGDVAQNYNLMVFNAKGKLVYENNMNFSSNAQRMIDLSNQSKGIYFMRLNTEKASFSRRIIIK